MGKRPGQIVLFSFPQTNLKTGKLRPALLIEKLPGPHDDWLICMLTSRLHQQVAGFDEVIQSTDSDFSQSGLKSESLIRITRLAVVEGKILVGTMGNISQQRLKRIRSKLAKWLNDKI